MRLLMEEGGRPATTVKLFLIGHPSAGKTTLKESLSRVINSNWVILYYYNYAISLSLDSESSNIVRLLLIRARQLK